MGRSIAFVSGKGGVGKTSIVAVAGALFAYSGKRVCLVDADFGLNNLDIVLGLENNILFDICDVLSGNARVNQALVNHPLCKNLYLLPVKNSSRSGGEISTFVELINYLSCHFDYVFIDSPAGIGRGFVRAVSGASETIVVTTPHISALRDADKVVGILKSQSAAILGVAVNQARGDFIAEGKMLGTKEIETILNLPVVGLIESCDAMLNLASGKITSVVGEQFLTLRNLCNNIEEGTKQTIDVAKKYKGLIGFFRRKKRRVV